MDALQKTYKDWLTSQKKIQQHFLLKMYNFKVEMVRNKCSSEKMGLIKLGTIEHFTIVMH